MLKCLNQESPNDPILYVYIPTVGSVMYAAVKPDGSAVGHDETDLILWTFNKRKFVQNSQMSVLSEPGSFKRRFGGKVTFRFLKFFRSPWHTLAISETDFHSAALPFESYDYVRTMVLLPDATDARLRFVSSFQEPDEIKQQVLAYVLPNAYDRKVAKERFVYSLGHAVTLDRLYRLASSSEELTFHPSA